MTHKEKKIFEKYYEHRSYMCEMNNYLNRNANKISTW